MKNNIYIFILFCFVSSCKILQNKKNIKDKYDFSNLLSDSTETNTTKKYSLSDYENKTKTEKSNILFDDVITNANGEGYFFVNKKLKVIEVNNTKVIKQNRNLSDGRIVYKIPNVMKIRSTYKVLVRISKSIASVSLYDSLSGIVKTSHIPITETMQVQLIDTSPKDKKIFDIISDDSEIQIIESGDTYTQWSWDVTPIHVGVSKLKVVVSIIRNNNKKDIVYEDTVEIERDIKEQLIFFWEEYWKWIISTFAIPIFIWWHKNRKKKKIIKNKKNRDGN